jgi:hypothetical protein
MANFSTPALRQRLVCSLAPLELSKSSANSDKYLFSFVHSLVNRYPEESRQCSCFGTCFFFFFFLHLLQLVKLWLLVLRGYCFGCVGQPTLKWCNFGHLLWSTGMTELSSCVIESLVLLASRICRTKYRFCRHVTHDVFRV